MVSLPNYKLTKFFKTVEKTKLGPVFKANDAFQAKLMTEPVSNLVDTKQTTYLLYYGTTRSVVWDPFGKFGLKKIESDLV